jgi:hypothetical protein
MLWYLVTVEEIKGRDQETRIVIWRGMFSTCGQTYSSETWNFQSRQRLTLNQVIGEFNIRLRVRVKSIIFQTDNGY